MEPVKKYAEQVQKTINQFSADTASVTSGIKELMILLNAISKGFIKNDGDIKRALEGVSKGQFKTADAIDKYFKNLQLPTEDIKKIIAYWDEIRTKTDDELKATADYIALQQELEKEFKSLNKIREEFSEKDEEQLDNLDTQVDLVSDLVEKYKEFSTTIDKNKGQIKALNIDLTKGSEISEQFLHFSEQILPNFFDVNKFIDAEELQKISKTLNDIGQAKMGGAITFKLEGDLDTKNIYDAEQEMRNKYLELMPNFKSAAAEQAKDLKSLVEVMMGYQRDLSTNQLVDIQTRQKLEASAARSIEDSLNEKVALISSISKQLTNVNKLSEDELSKLTAKLDSLSDQEKIIAGQHASFSWIIEDHESISKHIESQNKSYDELNAKIEKYSSQISEIGIQLQDITSAIPIGMQRLLGIENIGYRLSDSLTSALKAYNGALMDTGSKISAMSAATKSFGGTIKSLLGPVGLVAAAIGIIYTLVSGLESKVKNVGKEMGLSTKQSKKVVDDLLKTITAADNRLATEEDILAIQKAQVESNGRALDLTNETNRNLVQTAVAAENAFGITSTEAMDVMSLFKQIGADDTLAQNLLANIGHMAELAGIAPNIITKDLIEGAKEVSLYFAGMPKQAAKAAIQIRRMGMSIKQAGQIADKMLNIEGFMTDMFELSAMTNGKLNLSEAFDLRMQGDIEGMTKSIMGQIGSLNDFNQQHEFVQRKLASTLGMEVTDLRKSLKLKEMSNNLTGDQLTLLQQNLDQVGDIASMNVESMKAKAEELNSTKRLSAAFTKIKAVIYKALVPIIESFSELLTSSSGIVDGIGAAFTLVGTTIKLLTPFIKGFILPFKIIGDIVTAIVNGLERFFSPIGDATDSLATAKNELNSISGILSIIGTSICTIFGIRYISKITGLTKVFDKIFNKNLVGSATEGAQAAAAALGKTNTAPLIDKIKLAGTKIVDVFKNINLSSVAAKFKALGTKIAETFKNINVTTLSDKVKTIGPKITDIFKKINPFKTLTDSAKEAAFDKPIADTAEKTKGILGKMFDKINIFKSKNIVESASETISNKTISTETKAPDISKMEKAGSMFTKVSEVFKTAGEKIKSALSVVKDFIVGVADAIGQVMTSIGKGIGGFLGGIGEGLSKFQPKALIGVVAMAGLSGAVWILAKALQEFNSIDISSLAKAGIAILGVTAAMAGLGALMSSGIGAVAIGLGVVAIAAMAGSLFLLGKAIQAIGSGVSTIQSSLSSIVNIDFSRIKELTISLKDFVTTSSGLKTVADALQIIADSLSRLNIELSKLDLMKLGGLSYEGINLQKTLSLEPIQSIQAINSAPPVQPSNIINEIPTATTNIQPYEPSITQTSPSVQMDTKKIERKLDELIQIISIYSERPAYAVIPETTVKNLNYKLKGMNNK